MEFSLYRIPDEYTPKVGLYTKEYYEAQKVCQQRMTSLVLKALEGRFEPTHRIYLSLDGFEITVRLMVRDFAAEQREAEQKAAHDQTVAEAEARNREQVIANERLMRHMPLWISTEDWRHWRRALQSIGFEAYLWSGSAWLRTLCCLNMYDDANPFEVALMTLSADEDKLEKRIVPVDLLLKVEPVSPCDQRLWESWDFSAMADGRVELHWIDARNTDRLPIDDLSVTVYFYARYSDELRPQVNWGAYGSTSPERTRRYASLLNRAAALCDQLDWLRGNSTEETEA